MSAIAEFPRADYAANNIDPMMLAQALDHIARTAKASRSQTRRIRWIQLRAEMTLEGREYRDIDVDLPRKPVGDTHERIQRRMAYHIAIKHQLLSLLEELVSTEGQQPGTAEWAERVTAAIANAKASVAVEAEKCNLPSTAPAELAITPAMRAEAAAFAAVTGLDGESLEQAGVV